MGWTRRRGWLVALAALVALPACSSDGAPPAGAATATCNGLPTDLQIDTQNCGACGIVCAGIAAVCVGGACGCPPATGGLCADGCDDLSSDPRNCGACGNACGPGLACLNGTCGCADESMCAGQCTDLESDPGNCGSCGNTCGPKQKCVSGACTGACVTNGDCGMGELCNATVWLCVDGTTSCNSNLDCTDPATEYCGLGRCFVPGSRLFTFVAPDSGCAPGTENSNPSLSSCTDHFQTCSPTEPCANPWSCVAMTPNAVDGTCVQMTDAALSFVEAGTPPDMGANDGGAAVDATVVDSAGNGAEATVASGQDATVGDATVAEAAVGDAMSVDATLQDGPDAGASGQDASSGGGPPDDASSDGGSTDEAGDDTSADGASDGTSTDDAMSAASFDDGAFDGGP